MAPAWVSIGTIAPARGAALSFYRCVAGPPHGRRVTISCWLTGATDDGPAADPGLALMMIHEPVLNGDAVESPLGEYIGADDIVDREWLSQHAGAFVSGVAVTNGETHNEFRLDVEVTDPRWIEHLVAAGPWDSYACQTVTSYQDPPEPAAPAS